MIAVVAGLAVGSVAVCAADQALFLIRDVPAKGEGKTDAAAERSAAIAIAAAALQQLMRRLTARSDHLYLPQVSANRAHEMIKGVEVVRAKRSNTEKGRSFDGALSFLFDTGKVGAFLEASGIGWSARRSGPVLVLPIWSREGQLTLWDGLNPWRDTWEARNGEPGLVVVILPDGGFQDLQAINAVQAARRDLEALAAIAKSYEAQQVLVAVARRDDNEQVSVAAWLFGVRNGIAEQLDPVVHSGDEALARSAASLVSQLTERWKSQAIFPAGPSRTTDVTARFEGIEAWTRILEALDATPAVTDYGVIRFSADDAVLSLIHKGASKDLPALLHAFGLNLAGAEGNWVLRTIPKLKSEQE